MSLRLKKNDMVQLISGEHKGQAGKIIKIFPKKKTALVGEKNIVKRHTRPSPKNQQGGIVEKEAPIRLSNLMLICPKTGTPTRIGTKVLDDGKRVRFSKKAKELID